ncbi:armadillo-like helical domain-containing protein 3 [Styela clava]
MLRRGTESKKPIKEKILLLYDMIFKPGNDDLTSENPNFWDEFFLLKVHPEYIEKKFEVLSPKDVLQLKDRLNSMFDKCLEYIQCDQPVRVINALQTLSSLFRGIFACELGDHGFDRIDILIGFDMAETSMHVLLRCLTAGLLTDHYNTTIKSVILQLLLVIATGMENISQNTFVEYLMANESLYDTLVELLADPVARSRLGNDTVLLLALLVNYRKYEGVNPFIMKLSVLDNELALNCLGSVISSALASFNRQFISKQEETKSTGLFSTITNMVGSMFIGDSDEQKQMIKTNEAVLLALYEAIHLNRNFISVLTHSHADSIIGTPPRTPGGTDDESVPSLPNTPTPESVQEVSTTRNVLSTFLQYTSIVMQDTKLKQNVSSTKLCFIVLTCITEDQFANSFLHDDNMPFQVLIHRMPMRHRKQKSGPEKGGAPLACWLLDLTVEFIVSHMMKDFPFRQHMRCLGVIHRLMCYEKKCQIRLMYNWRELWTALINLLKFLLANESTMVNNWKKGIFALFTQIVNIFNMFITFGDTFLPTPTSYDELYYEIIRMHQVFDNLQAFVIRYSNNLEYKDIVPRLASAMVNLQAIIRHFTPRIDKWTKDNNLTSLTEEEVLEVVRNNYDNLTLKLQDSLDHFERYSERPKETHFFTELVRSITEQYKKNVTFANINLQDFMHLA